MKIAITSKGTELSSEIDPRFGRCKYFIFIDTETMEFVCKENPFINASGGAGVQAGQLVVSENPDLIITGDLGPKALSTVQASGIEYITKVTGTIEEVVERYKKK